jgi:hypothetical protein
MGKWTDADAQALLELVKAHGADWALIAKSLPGSRNPNEIKQKHYKLTLPKEKRDQQLEKKRKGDRKGGMSAERLEKKRKTDQERSRSATESLASAARSDANTQLRQEILNTASDGTGTCECSDEDCFCRRKAAILLNLTRTRLPQNWSCE